MSPAVVPTLSGGAEERLVPLGSYRNIPQTEGLRNSRRLLLTVLVKLYVQIQAAGQAFGLWASLCLPLIQTVGIRHAHWLRVSVFQACKFITYLVKILLLKMPQIGALAVCFS